MAWSSHPLPIRSSSDSVFPPAGSKSKDNEIAHDRNCHSKLQSRRLIGYTIESVLGQKYAKLKYGVVEGGSTDGTAEIVTKYQHRLADYVNEGDNGQADVIAKGFNNLSGDIMAYLNSDDLLMPGALRFVGDFFAGHPDIDVIYGHRIIVDESGREVGRWILRRQDTEAIRHFDYIPQETL